MSDQNVQQARPILSDVDQRSKSAAMVAYILMATGFIFGVTYIAGAIYAMVKKGDARGTKFEDHYSNMIRTFWISAALYVVGIITALVIVGYFIILGAWIWALYRVIKGITRLSDERAYND